MKSHSQAQLSASQIAEKIVDGIMEHRIPPGCKLSEDKLAEAFQVSRTKIRQALTSLANEGVVNLMFNRGAFVARPTVEEAIELFDARFIMEPEIIKRVINNVTEGNIISLKAHLAKEASAREKNDRHQIIRLSGEFHMLLAACAGNRFLEKMMAELCPLTCLMIALYDSPRTSACPKDEHALIVNAIEKRDVQEAIRIMNEHLAHIKEELNIHSFNTSEIRWESIYG